MDPFERLLAFRRFRPGAAAAGMLLAAAACWPLTGAARAAPPVQETIAPDASHSVTKVQFGRGGPLARARLKRRLLTPGRIARPKRPPATAGKLSAPKVTPPRPSCGVRGRPPCRTAPKTASPAIVTPPSGPGCKGSACPPPSRPPLILTPGATSPPRGGRFDASYFGSLPRIAEGRQVHRGPPVFPRHVLVLIDQGQPATLEDDLARQYRLRRVNGQVLTLIAARAQLYAIRDGRTVAAVVSALAGDPRVRLAQANFSYRRQGETGKSTPPEAPQYALAKISIAPAHELALGRGVRIAVIDSGIDAAHPDLVGVVVSAFDATDRAAAPSDGHGTAVAGIIGARGGAVRGVAPMADILAVRAFASLGKQQPIASSSVILLRAIEWSVVNGAQVLNMSFVGPRDPAVRAMIEAAQKRGAVVVAAAGNGGSNAPAAYPAAYPDVIAVTAIDATDRRYVHANRGSYIAVSAPGVDILAPADGGTHAFLSGTSFAAAHVSGIVALLLERSRSLLPQGALAALSDNAVDLGPAGRDEDFGFGRADAYAALRALAPSK